MPELKEVRIYDINRSELLNDPSLVRIYQNEEGKYIAVAELRRTFKPAPIKESPSYSIHETTPKLTEQEAIESIYAALRALLGERICLTERL